MAKSIVLYGVFLGAFICFCAYFNSTDVSSYRQSAVSDKPADLRTSTSYPTVRLSLKQAVGGEIASVSTSITANQSLAFRDQETFGVFHRTWQAHTAQVKGDEESARARQDLRQIYSAEIGVREKTGKNDGERVEEYLAVTQLGKGYAWCASFVSWVFAEAGFPQPRTPWSPSLFPKERVVWERGLMRENRSFASLEDDSSANTPYLKPNTSRLIPGPPGSADVFGIYFADLKRIAHVGFVDEWGDKYVITTEGNTNEAGSNEGDGVYRKRRLISSIYQVADWVQGQERGIK